MHQLPGEFHDQDRVFTGESYEHHEADLREDRDVHPCPIHAHERRQQAHRHDQNHGQRQSPALVKCCQHQKHQHDAEYEQECGRGPRADLHEGHLRPLSRHQRRDRPLLLQPVEMPLHDSQGGRASRARCRLAVDRGGGVEVVPHHERWADTVFHLHQCRQRHRLAACPGHLEFFDGTPDVAAMPGIGLHVYLPRPAEAVEVVDVVRPQLELQGLEEALERNPDRGRLVPVDVEKQPGGVGGEVGEQTA